MNLFETTKELCRLYGIPGREQSVAAYLRREAAPYASAMTTDPLGNLIVWKKGAKTPHHRLMLAAHMDEVGMMVTAITKEGYLRFAAAGGITPRVFPGRRVYLPERGIYGVIGTKAVHQQTAEERDKLPSPDSLYLDIGAANEEEAKKLVSLGDSICFTGDYFDLSEQQVAARALDDRVGCAILLELLRQPLPYDAAFCFTVQEELGCRGAGVATRAVSPEVALVVETTASGDVSGVSGEKRVSVIGGGAVVSYMDAAAVYDKGLYDHAFRLAEEQGIPVQTKTMLSGGNDGSKILATGTGVRTLAISVPTKYLHSPLCVADKDDITAVYELTRAMLWAADAL